MAVDVRSMACTYLRNGKVTVLIAGPTEGTRLKPLWVWATVEGNSATYLTGCSIDAGWWCTCDESSACAHVAAVQLVTGYDGLARKASGESG